MFSWNVLLVAFTAIVTLWVCGSILERLFERKPKPPLTDDAIMAATASPCEYLPEYRALPIGGGWMLAHGLLDCEEDGRVFTVPATFLFSPNGKVVFVERKRSCARTHS